METNKNTSNHMATMFSTYFVRVTPTLRDAKLTKLIYRLNSLSEEHSESLQPAEYISQLGLKSRTLSKMNEFSRDEINEYADKFLQKTLQNQYIPHTNDICAASIIPTLPLFISSQTEPNQNVLKSKSKAKLKQLAKVARSKKKLEPVDLTYETNQTEEKLWKKKLGNVKNYDPLSDVYVLLAVDQVSKSKGDIQVQLPRLTLLGGKTEKTDRNWVSTALREFHEEIGGISKYVESNKNIQAHMAYTMNGMQNLPHLKDYPEVDYVKILKMMIYSPVINSRNIERYLTLPSLFASTFPLQDSLLRSRNSLQPKCINDNLPPQLVTDIIESINSHHRDPQEARADESNLSTIKPAKPKLYKTCMPIIPSWAKMRYRGKCPSQSDKINAFNKRDSGSQAPQLNPKKNKKSRLAIPPSETIEHTSLDVTDFKKLIANHNIDPNLLSKQAMVTIDGEELKTIGLIWAPISELLEYALTTRGIITDIVHISTIGNVLLSPTLMAAFQNPKLVTQWKYLLGLTNPTKFAHIETFPFIPQRDVQTPVKSKGSKDKSNKNVVNKDVVNKEGEEEKSTQNKPA